MVVYWYGDVRTLMCACCFMNKVHTGYPASGNQKLLYFPLHLNSVSALPGETQTMENASSQLNTVCWLWKKTCEAH